MSHRMTAKALGRIGECDALFQKADRYYLLN